MDQQLRGGRHDSVNSVSCKSVEESKILFDQMQKVFLDINLWDHLFKQSTEFKMRNAAGEDQSSTVQKGNLVSIKIPGPKNNIGDGYDWVVVKNIEIIENNQLQKLTMELQPCYQPKNSKYTAHFFKTMAKNYFIIKKEGTEITAEVHGRNEIPNCSGVPLRDRIRNFFIANGGIFGMSKIQWEVWSKNILNEKYLQKCLKNSK